MGHIAGRGGRFITVLPRSRTEDATFRDWLQSHTPDWTEAARRGGRLGEPEQVYSTTAAPLPSAEGYRITWVHSTAKAARDGAARQARIEAGIIGRRNPTAADNGKAGPKYLNTLVPVAVGQDEAVAELVDDAAGAGDASEAGGSDTPTRRSR
jgi:hypothetical protein